MTKLPKNAVDILRGKFTAHNVAENIAVAYWMHSRDNDTALFLWNIIHADFAQLADALGYTITRKEVAQAEEVAA